MHVVNRTAGVVIVGNVDGNRIWSKEVGGNLCAVEVTLSTVTRQVNPFMAVQWSSDSQQLIFGLTTNEVHVFDMDGNFVV